MFEAAELGHHVSKAVYKEEEAQLRAALLRLQGELRDAGFPVLIVVSGEEGAGRSETVHVLLEWMDARGVITHAFGEPSDEERERPRFWRYWMALPPKGKIGILFGSWYTEPIAQAVFGGLSGAELDRELDRIEDFERMLTNEGVLVLKFWMHLSKEAQKKRLKSLEKDPQQRWRVTKHEWDLFHHYDQLRAVSERCLRRTSTAEAPWHVVEGVDPRYRNLTVGRMIRDAIEGRLRQPRLEPARPKEPHPEPAPVNIINQLDLGLALPRDEYQEQLSKYQGRLNVLSRLLHERKRSMILVVEGPDAAGKGGAIRRLTAAMDARLYRVISIAAPTEEERSQPYLWRFWRHLPRQGSVTIYDRSWYGRVLVERLEGFCAPEDWQRAYSEINSFEEQLVEAGIVLGKFWIAVSPEEQLRRFREREETPYKQYKMCEEDWRNREKWPAYEAAACDMIERTGTEIAPWTLVEGDNKRWARIKVLKTVCHSLGEALEKD